MMLTYQLQTDIDSNTTTADILKLLQDDCTRCDSNGVDLQRNWLATTTLTF